MEQESRFERWLEWADGRLPDWIINLVVWVADSVWGITFTFVVAAIIGVVTAWAIHHERVVCREQALKMGLPYYYASSPGCMVQIDGRWWPLANVQKEVR